MYGKLLSAPGCGKGTGSALVAAVVAAAEAESVPAVSTPACPREQVGMHKTRSRAHASRAHHFSVFTGDQGLNRRARANQVKFWRQRWSASCSQMDTFVALRFILRFRAYQRGTLTRMAGHNTFQEGDQPSGTGFTASYRNGCS